MLLDDLKDRRWYSHLKEEALDRTMLSNILEEAFGPVVRQITEWANDWHIPTVDFHIFLNLLQISDRNLSYEREHSYWQLSFNINSNV
jgi:hypothetical protein